MACRHHYHRHDWHQSRCTTRRGGAGKRLLSILAVGVVVALATYMFRSSSERTISPPPAPQRLASLSGHHLQDYAADSGVVGGATAAERAIAAMPVPPEAPVDPDRTVTVSVPVPPNPESNRVVVRPVTELTPGKPKPVIKLRVRSDKPYPSREMALNDALMKAGNEIHDTLRTLNPPVEARPGWARVKADYLRPESITYPKPSDEVKKEWAEASLDTNRVWAEIEVEVMDHQVRELRSEQRISTAGMIGSVGFVLVLALFGFLKLDGWTRGYLTAGLALAIVAAAGAAVALLVLA